MTTLKQTISIDNIHLENSYLISKTSEMRAMLKLIQTSNSECQVFQKRSMFSLINEWQAHNLLFKLGIQKDRTKDVDLDILSHPQWLYDMCYFLIALIYKLFSWF